MTRQIKEEMLRGGAMNAMMSGSGPTVFGLFRERSMAKKTAEQIRQKGFARQIYTTTIHKYERTGGTIDGSRFGAEMNEYLPLRDVVFNTLRQAILRGELKPGERLMEVQLAKSWA